MSSGGLALLAESAGVPAPPTSQSALPVQENDDRRLFFENLPVPYSYRRHFFHMAPHVKCRGQ